MKGLPTIVHEAVVRRTDALGGYVYVAVSDHEEEACSSCAAALLCRRNQGNELRIKVSKAERYKPGQRVRIGAGGGMHRRAVGLMLLLPCLMFVVCLAGCGMAGLKDWQSGLAGLGGAAFTYVTLYVCRRRLWTKFEFEMLEEECM